MKTKFAKIAILAVPALLMLASCNKEENGNPFKKQGDSVISLVIGGDNTGTKAMASQTQTGAIVSDPIDLSEDSGIEGLTLQEEVTSLDDLYFVETPETKGTPVYTQNLNMHYSTLAVTAYSGSETWGRTDVPYDYDGSQSSDTKKVYFSQGNLTYNVSTTTWAFYEHQYDCATGYDANLISLFTWGYNATSSIVPDGKNYVSGHNTDGESFNAGEDWGTQIGDGNTWRTLSTAEWEWLLGPISSPTPGTNCRTSSTVNGTENARYLKCKVNDGTRDVYGLMIFPDTFTWPTGTDAPSAPTGINVNDLAWESESESVPGYTSSQFEALEKAGVVFLPAAGYRNGTSVINVGTRGYSWSSTAGSSSGAYALYFSEGRVDPADRNRFDSGRSVRLVSVVQ